MMASSDHIVFFFFFTFFSCSYFISFFCPFLFFFFSGKNLIFEASVLRTHLPDFHVRPWLADMRYLPPKTRNTPKFADASQIFVRHFHACCVLMTQFVP